MNGTIAVPPPDPATFKQPRGAVWVNGLWLLSLTLALIVAVLATLVRQWLVEYKSRNRAVIESQKRWAWRHMVYRGGLDRWRIEAFIAVLPVMLHVALFLFLAGLALFVRTLHTGLADTVAGLAVAMGTLYLAATLMPIWQGDCPTVTPLLRLGYGIWRKLRIVISRLWRTPNSVTEFLPAFDEAVLLGDNGNGRTRRVLKWMLRTLVDREDVLVTLAALGSLGGEGSDPDSLHLGSIKGHADWWLVMDGLPRRYLQQPHNIHPVQLAAILRLQMIYPIATVDTQDFYWPLVRRYDGHILHTAVTACGTESWDEVVSLAQKLVLWFTVHDEPPYLPSTRDIIYGKLMVKGLFEHRFLCWEFASLYFLSITRTTPSLQFWQIMEDILRFPQQNHYKIEFGETPKQLNPSSRRVSPLIAWQMAALYALSRSLCSQQPNGPSQSQRLMLHRAYGHVLSQVTTTDTVNEWPDLPTFVGCLSFAALAKFAEVIAPMRTSGWLGLVRILQHGAQRDWNQPDRQGSWKWTKTLARLYGGATRAVLASTACNRDRMVVAIALDAFDALIPEKERAKVRESIIELVEPVSCDGHVTSLWAIVCSAVRQGDVLMEVILCKIVRNIAEALLILRDSNPVRAARLTSELLDGGHVDRSLAAAMRVDWGASHNLALVTASDLAELAPAHWIVLKEQLYSVDTSQDHSPVLISKNALVAAITSVQHLEPELRWWPSCLRPDIQRYLSPQREMLSTVM